MIKNICRAAILSLALISCENEENKLLCYGTHSEIQGDITLAGAVGDGNTDCSEIINKMIAELPAEGGTIVIPEGDFVLDAPIVIGKNNVTIKGLNSGFRSNIDVKDEELQGPGGGSKLIVRNAQAAIHVKVEGLTGINIESLMISGGTSNNGVGILFEKGTAGANIKNVVGINLITGIEIHQAKNLTISDCWICELSNSIILDGGENNTVKNCQLGSQPTGNTCQFKNEKGLIFQKNQVYPDGKSNLVLENCDDSDISNNNFKSYYVAILDLKGNNNKVCNNIFWLADAVGHQLLDKGANYGVVRIAGENNHFSTNTLTCEWAVGDAVTVRATEGKNNVFENCLIEDVASSQVFLVNQYAVITNCVSDDKIAKKVEEPEIDKLAAKVGLLVLAETEADVQDDDELAALKWFKEYCTEGTVLTPAQLATTDLSAYKAIWVLLDRVGIGHGPDKLPIAHEEVSILTDYYKNGGNLLLTNHATQLINLMGRCERVPGIFGDGEGGSGGDIWVINANIGVGIPDRADGYDQRAHPVFAKLWTAAPWGYETFPLIGPGQREDHNCMWDLNAYGYPSLYPDAENVVNAFQKENNATVLATWGHVQDWCCAGLVEFKPTDSFAGTCLAMGLAAYEWNQNSNANEYQYNIKQMTYNMLDYLSKE